MAVIVSKVDGGLLTFTATSGASAGTAKDASCQSTSVTITPGDGGTASGTDASYVLCGDLIPAEAAGGTGKGDKLDFTIVSDHNTVNGIVAFSWAHRGEAVKFTFIPNQAPGEAGGAAQSWSGVVTMQPLAVGGEVKGDLRISGSLDIIALTPPDAAGAAPFGKGYLPLISQAYAGVTFPANAKVTASDKTNADKLLLLGYKPVGYDQTSPPAAWTIPGDKITIGTYDFHWGGTNWLAGAVT